MKRDNHTFEHFTNVVFEMPLSGRFPWELFDNHSLPNDLLLMTNVWKVLSDNTHLWVKISCEKNAKILEG